MIYKTPPRIQHSEPSNAPLRKTKKLLLDCCICQLVV